MLGSCSYLRCNPFVRVSAKYGSSTVVGFNAALAEDKMRRFKGESAHFGFNKGPIYTHDGASARFSTHSHQCCGSGMFIPDPDFYPSRILDLGSRSKNNRCCGSETKVSDPVSDPDPA
jgi:hypothetical protein